MIQRKVSLNKLIKRSEAHHFIVFNTSPGHPEACTELSEVTGLKLMGQIVMRDMVKFALPYLAGIAALVVLIILIVRAF